MTNRFYTYQQNIINNTTNPTYTDDVTQGFQVGSRWINQFNLAFWMCLDPAPGGATWVLFTPWITNGAPTVNSDSAHGYNPGNIWLDLTNRTQPYMCEGSNDGAAVWKQFTLA